MVVAHLALQLILFIAAIILRLSHAVDPSKFESKDIFGFRGDLFNKSREFFKMPLPRETPIEMITANGYPAENHLVTTDDGYLLELHRIPRGINGSVTDDVKRPPIFLMHCIFCSSADWLANHPKKALGYMLADRGYDVWMGNARGNTFSKAHINLTTDSREFWQFSFTEVATVDIPNSIDYILHVTKSPKVNYLGFSLGATTLFAMLSEKPEYNEKIIASAVMGPAVFMTNSKGPIPKLSPFINLIQTTLEMIRVYELFPSTNPVIKMFNSHFCRKRDLALNHMCIGSLSTSIDIEKDRVNWDFIPTIFNYLPAGSSLNTFVHYNQIKNADSFRHFDFGPDANLKKYGARIPPDFNLNFTHVPVGLFVGKGDKLISIKDVMRLISKLPSNIATLHIVPSPTFYHFDFLWSRNADVLLYNTVINYLDKHNSISKDPS